MCRPCLQLLVLPFKFKLKTMFCAAACNKAPDEAAGVSISTQQHSPEDGGGARPAASRRLTSSKSWPSMVYWSIIIFFASEQRTVFSVEICKGVSALMPKKCGRSLRRYMHDKRICYLESCKETFERQWSSTLTRNLKWRWDCRMVETQSAYCGW